MNEENKCPDCGEYKDKDHRTCFPCSLGDDQMDLCECGEPKNPDYKLCYQCNQDKVEQAEVAEDTEQGKKNWCECGEWKKPEFDHCFMCSKRIRANIFAKFRSNS